MEILLDKIIKECEKRGIKTQFDEETCKYYITNIIDKKLCLYATDEAVIFENNHGDKEHVISFRDMVHVTHYWMRRYQDDDDWESVGPNWALVFKEFLGSSQLKDMMISEELPF